MTTTQIAISAGIRAIDRRRFRGAAGGRQPAVV